MERTSKGMEPMSSVKDKARWRECEGVSGEALVYVVGERTRGGKLERLFRTLDEATLEGAEAGMDWEVQEKSGGIVRLVARVPEPRTKYTAATFFFQGDEPPTHVFVFPSVEAMEQHKRRVRCPVVEDFKYSYVPEQELEALRRGPSLRTFVHPHAGLPLDSEPEVETPVRRVPASRHVIRRPALAVLESDSSGDSFPEEDFMEVDRSPSGFLTSGRESGSEHPLVISQRRVLRRSKGAFRSLTTGRRRLLSEAREPSTPASPPAPLPSKETRETPAPPTVREQSREKTPPPTDPSEEPEEPKRKRQVRFLFFSFLVGWPCSRVQGLCCRSARSGGPSTFASVSRGSPTEGSRSSGGLSGAKLSLAMSFIAVK